MASKNGSLTFDVSKGLARSRHTRALQIDDEDGKLFTKGNEVMERRLEYCRDLYNEYELNPEDSLLQEERRNG